MISRTNGSTEMSRPMTETARGLALPATANLGGGQLRADGIGESMSECTDCTNEPLVGARPAFQGCVAFRLSRGSAARPNRRRRHPPWPVRPDSPREERHWGG